MKKFLKFLVLFAIGGSLYCLLELLFRQYTFSSMFVVGGICFLICGNVNEYFRWDTPLWLQMLICSILITVVEFIAGCLLNLTLNLHIWDYSNLPFNLYGQICLYFSILWFFISFIGIILDDYIRYWFFGEEKPKYKLI